MVDIRIDPNQSVADQVNENLKKLPQAVRDQLIRNVENAVKALREVKK